MNQAAISASDPLGQNGLNLHHNKTSIPAIANFIWMKRALVLLLSGSFINCAFAAVLVRKVIGILDGDTMDVLDSSKVTHRIRLTGIDAPAKAQAFGQRSKENLSDLIFGKQVEVQAVKSDKYGRTVGKVLVRGLDANFEQVKSGFAWHYKRYESEQSVSDYELYPTLRSSYVARAQDFGSTQNQCPSGLGGTAEKTSRRRLVLRPGAPVMRRSSAQAPKASIIALHRVGKSDTTEE
jgi:endonuclease YncB( thermonuclease family)